MEISVLYFCRVYSQLLRLLNFTKKSLGRVDSSLQISPYLVQSDQIYPGPKVLTGHQILQHRRGKVQVKQMHPLVVHICGMDARNQRLHKSMKPPPYLLVERKKLKSAISTRAAEGMSSNTRQFNHLWDQLQLINKLLSHCRFPLNWKSRPFDKLVVCRY